MENIDNIDDNIIISYKKNNIYSISYKINNKNVPIRFTTTNVKVPFGIEKYYDSYILKIQLLDTDLIQFINFIENKVQQINSNHKYTFVSQIQKSKKPYPDLLIVKIDNNKTNRLDITSTSGNFINMFDIKKNAELSMDIYVDNIWCGNNKIIAKFKTRRIHIFD